MSVQFMFAATVAAVLWALTLCPDATTAAATTATLSRPAAVARTGHFDRRRLRYPA
jgi:shikimate kinase